MPVRRNSTYEKFPWDWTSRPRRANSRRRHRDRCAAGASNTPTICRFMPRSMRERSSIPERCTPTYPSRLNAMLLRGELDLSPISAFAWAANARASSCCCPTCASARATKSSRSCSSRRCRRQLLDGAPIFVTAGVRHRARSCCASSSSGATAFAPTYVDEPQPFARALAGEPTLLIGDSAIDAIERFPPSVVYDLGRLWHEWSGEQTVFAVWAARRDAYAARPGRRARLHARAHRRVHVVALARRAVVALAQRTIARPAGFYESVLREAELHASRRRAERTGRVLPRAGRDRRDRRGSRRACTEAAGALAR